MPVWKELHSDIKWLGIYCLKRLKGPWQQKWSSLSLLTDEIYVFPQSPLSSEELSGVSKSKFIRGIPEEGCCSKQSWVYGIHCSVTWILASIEDTAVLQQVTPMPNSKVRRVNTAAYASKPWAAQEHLQQKTLRGIFLQEPEKLVEVQIL